jgi:hypothetical protein
VFDTPLSVPNCSWATSSGFNIVVGVILARWQFFIEGDRDRLANAKLDKALSDEFNRVMKMIPEEAVHGEFGEIAKKIPLAASFLTARRIVVGLILLAQLYGEEKVADINNFARNQLQAWKWLPDHEGEEYRSFTDFSEDMQVTVDRSPCAARKAVKDVFTPGMRMLVDLFLDASFDYFRENEAYYTEFKSLVPKSKGFFSSVIRCPLGSRGKGGSLFGLDGVTAEAGGYESNSIKDELINRHKELIIAVLLANPGDFHSLGVLQEALNLRQEVKSNPVGNATDNEEQARRKNDFLHNFGGINPLKNPERKGKNKSATSSETAVDGNLVRNLNA